MIITLAIALLQISQQPTYDHVILISVDGLRSDALLTEQAKSFKNFQRLLKGANTLNARTDCDFTTTLPNHTGMLTSRLVNGPQGHGYTANTTPAARVVGSRSWGLSILLFVRSPFVRSPITVVVVVRTCILQG